MLFEVNSDSSTSEDPSSEAPPDPQSPEYSFRDFLFYVYDRINLTIRFLACVVVVSLPPMIAGHAILRAMHPQDYSAASLASSAGIVAAGIVSAPVPMGFSAYLLAHFSSRASSSYLLNSLIFPLFVACHASVVVFMSFIGIHLLQPQYAEVVTLSPLNAARAGGFGVVVIDAGLLVVALLSLAVYWFARRTRGTWTRSCEC